MYDTQQYELQKENIIKQIKHIQEYPKEYLTDYTTRIHDQIQELQKTIQESDREIQITQYQNKMREIEEDNVVIKQLLIQCDYKHIQDIYQSSLDIQRNYDQLQSEIQQLQQQQIHIHSIQQEFDAQCIALATLE
jgi:DNA repair ATPase RecN